MHRHINTGVLKSPDFLANRVQRIKTHEHVKFWQNQSIGCKDINIIQFFKMAGDAILDFRSEISSVSYTHLTLPTIYSV